MISSFENVFGSGFGDNLSGTNGANHIGGQAGSDTIDARGGNDTIEGGQGNDILTGGSGFDTFVFNTFDDNTGTDRILDFDVDRDTIRFDVDDSDNSNVTMSFGNYNPYSMTVDVIVRLGDTGTVILDDLSIGDVTSVMGQIEIV